MTQLSVNLNKVALIRNARDIGEPKITQAARIALDAGAYGITVHPRPDERHTRYQDVYDLAAILGEVEFNIEGNPFTGRYLDIVKEVRPDQATLVPDSPQASTSDHGWDLTRDKQRLTPIVKELTELGIRVSLFMDPDIPIIEIAKDLGADRIELYTEPYARAFREQSGDLEKVIGQYADAARAAADMGLGINAGHDLNRDNLGRFCSEVPNVLEVSIGQALIVDAIEIGLYNAVAEYVKILKNLRKS